VELHPEQRLNFFSWDRTRGFRPNEEKIKCRHWLSNDDWEKHDSLTGNDVEHDFEG